MGLSNKKQRALYESALEAVYKNENTGQEIPVVDAGDNASLDNIEAIVMDYIKNATGNSINESVSEQQTQEIILEAVQNLNDLCYLVNEYFGYNR